MVSSIVGLAVGEVGLYRVEVRTEARTRRWGTLGFLSLSERRRTAVPSRSRGRADWVTAAVLKSGLDALAHTQFGSLPADGPRRSLCYRLVANSSRIDDSNPIEAQKSFEVCGSHRVLDTAVGTGPQRRERRVRLCL